MAFGLNNGNINYAGLLYGHFINNLMNNKYVKLLPVEIILPQL